MRIEVLCTGDELLTGITADTNSPFFMERLLLLGEKVAWSQTVGDVSADITFALKALAERAEAVLVSGGLGPTSDDLTMACAAAAAGVPLVEAPHIAEHIRRRFAERGLALSPNNLRQAWVPQGAEAVLNPVGSAPMVVQRLGRGVFFYVPGVPREYRHLVEHEVLPRLAKLLAAQPHRVFRAGRILKTVGIAESHLDQQISDAAKAHPKVIFGFRTHAPENHLKLLAEGTSQADADGALAAAEAECRAVLGEVVFGADGDTFAGVVVRKLGAAQATLAAAESCSGGLVAELVTDVPGASAVFLGSAVVYSESLKTGWADVPEALLAREGAVSAPVAKALAAGVRARTGATWGLGVTGFAGPTGGTATDPVGTVYVGIAGPGVEAASRHLFSGPRDRVRQFAAYTALDVLRRHL